MGEFLDAHDLPKLNMDEVNNFNRPITNKEIEVLVKQNLKKGAESTVLDLSTEESTTRPSDN